jgi:hypothetical protein
MTGPVIYVVTRNNNGVYISTDEGVTFTQSSSTVLTNEVTDVALGDRNFTHSVITYGDGAATTPYYSFDDGVTYQAGQNTLGKEVTYVGQNTYVFGSTNSASGSGSRLQMSFDEGISIGATIDTAPLFNYPGAVFSNITVTGFDFPNSAGGYITIAGNQNNSAADQILTRTFDRGVSFPDALILPGSMGIIRGVWTSPERNVVFAIGDPDSIRGVLYSINPSLTEAPVKVLDGITIGSVTNDLTVKFASVPSTYNTYAEPEVPFTTYVKYRSKVYFLDSAGRIYYSDDDGFTWEFRSQIPATCVDIVALTENIVLVLSNSPEAVYKSTDGGFTFTRNAQPSWIDPRAMAYTFANDCDECNLAFEEIPNTFPARCIVEDRRMGTLCKSPYIYSSALGSCAKPSTIAPTNLLLSLDYSGSVGSEETALFRGYMQLLLSSLEDRLLDGSMQIAIVGWSTNACLQQGFTSDVNLLRTIINTAPPGDCDEGLTNHSAEICLSLRTIYDQSVLRPTAENVLVIFTDSGDAAVPNPSIGAFPVRGCDLSDIGLLPVVPPDDGGGDWSAGTDGMYQLVKNAKTELNNGVGLKIMAVSLGSLGERNTTKNFFVDGPKFFASLGPSYVIPSPVPNTSNYYFFDGGTFDTAEFIADQIRLGLAAEIISSPQCPDGCIGVPGIDGLGYCTCDEEFQANLCTAEIINCDNGVAIPVLATSTVRSLFGKVVKLRGSFPGDPEPFYYDDARSCWTVQPTTTYNPNYQNIRINTNIGALGGFPDCPTCTNPPWYRFTDCLDDTFIIYGRNTSFQILVNNGDVVFTHFNYPDRCLFVENIGSDGSYTESGISTTGITGRGEDCDFCPREEAINYKLTDCTNASNIIYCLGTTNDLQAYIGQVVNIQGLADVCWLVETDTVQQTIYQDVIVAVSYPDCVGCLPVTTYAFTNCQDQNTTVYTRLDFSAYVGQVVRLQEYPGICWSCFDTNITPPLIQALTINGLPFIECDPCIVRYYQLTNCANPETFLISTTDLSLYMGRTITAAGYPGLCFTVSEPECNCVRATVNGIEYSINAETNLFNGRKYYRFTSESGDPLAIAWSVNPNRWELFNQNTLETYGFSNQDVECPFINLWTTIQGSAYIISSVGFCVDDIYNIAPELDYADCTPCINCI